MKSTWSALGWLSFVVLIWATFPREPSVLNILGQISFLSLLAVCLYRWCWRPLDIVHPLDELTQNGKKAKQRASLRRRMKNFPPYFPNGWFRLCNSVDVRVGQVKHIKAFNKHLVVFRGEDGNVRILDAYCPHLGANLAYGGQVVGNEIRCPFHGWQFDGSGKCTNIPYTDREIPSQANTKCHTFIESNGIIKLWHHADRSAPTWQPPVLKGIEQGTLLYHGRSIHHVEAHCQEIPENGADVAHLGVLHVPLIVEWLGNFTGLQHTWTATWDKGTQDAPHLAHIKLTQAVSLAKRVIPGTKIAVTITQIGPGIVHLHFQTPFGKVYVVETVTPISQLVQQCSHTVFAEAQVPRFFAKFVLRGLIVQFERDIPIWNNKSFLPRPVLVQGDGKITQFRRWYQQFYSESSAQISKFTDDGADW